MTAGRPPRVLVDATSVPADRGGVGRYVDGLLGALGRMSTEQIDLAVVAQRTDAERYSRMLVDAEVIAGPAAIAHRPARLAWEQTGLPLVAAQVEADVVHAPQYTMPLRSGRPVVVTLHDATVFTDPDLYASVRGTFFRSATRTAVRRAARIITPSQATKGELERELSADPARVDVAPHGVNPVVFHPPADEEKERVQARLGLGGAPYLAFLSGMEPRKNVPALVRAWIKASAGRDAPPVLVLAGGTGGWDDQIDVALAEVPSGLRVLRPGYLRFQDLAGYLGGTTLFVHSAFSEGFCLPVLEAMACGAPVLTTEALAVPEVGGDAVAYTAPDSDAIADALESLLDDPARRADLAARGIARAAEFTWARSAELHLASYARAVAEQ